MPSASVHWLSIGVWPKGSICGHGAHGLLSGRMCMHVAAALVHGAAGVHGPLSMHGAMCVHGAAAMLAAAAMHGAVCGHGAVGVVHGAGGVSMVLGLA